MGGLLPQTNSLVVLDGNRDGVELLPPGSARPAEQEERQRGADPREHGAGKERRLEAPCQTDPRVRAGFAAR